jgi:hypothetical protein
MVDAVEELCYVEVHHMPVALGYVPAGLLHHLVGAAPLLPDAPGFVVLGPEVCAGAPI